MNKTNAVSKLREVLRRKHLAWSTEVTYCDWVVRFCGYLKKASRSLTSEQKLENFLSGLARDGVSASTQNQAFNAVLFFYTHVLKQELKGVNALRARRPETIRIAPSTTEISALIRTAQDVHGYPTRLIVLMLYGCGLRVSEPLNLRLKDVLMAESRLIIRGAKGGKDRVVAIPCSLIQPLKQQIKAARVTWERDAANRIPVPLPGLLARKYPQAQFAWHWAWLFPAHKTCRHPRTGETVRWRVHEANVQRTVKTAARKLGLCLTPHHLRHAYATHTLNRGANIRDLQAALGHSQLNTTMGYITPQALSVPSPLEALPAQVSWSQTALMQSCAQRRAS